MSDSTDLRPGGPSKPADGAGKSRSEYVDQAEIRLAETKQKLEGIGDRVETIEKAMAQVRTYLATIERRLARLKASDQVSGNHLRQSIDSAWDDLAVAIKNIVGRLA